MTAGGRGFPTDFPVVSSSGAAFRQDRRRGFPTDFPVVSSIVTSMRAPRRRGFPTDFPVVSSLRHNILKLL